MKRVWFALCSLVAALTLPAYAGNDRPAAGAANAPAAASAAPAPSARPGAEQPLMAEVMILHATHRAPDEEKYIDPRIGKLPELEKPPFSSYDRYELRERARLPLKKDAPQNLKLPNGRTLQVRLLKELGPDSVLLSASINHTSGKEFLPLLEVKAHVGQAFIVAGQSHKKGILVLVIRVVK